MARGLNARYRAMQQLVEQMGFLLVARYRYTTGLIHFIYFGTGLLPWCCPDNLL
jgi:hypothetical protein